MRLVIDTNVLISGLLSNGSLPAHLLVLWRDGRFDLLTSTDQIDELMRVTRYPKIRERLSPALAGRLINELRDLAMPHPALDSIVAAVIQFGSKKNLSPPRNSTAAKRNETGEWMATDLATETMRKVERRLVPFCILLFVVAFIDRINVGFAALQMNQQLGIGAEAFGAGVGIFFIGYFLFEVPSNLILHRVGARIWISRIVISWGLLTALHVFIQGPQSFYLMRFLLGLAEAGFAPGLLFYFTLWFPARYRGAAMSKYLTASAIAVIVGAPFSTSIFQLSGLLGLAGWQWMFLIEGALGVILGLVTLGYLTDRPQDATWLDAEERAWLVDAMHREPARQAAGAGDFRKALADYRVWVLTFMFFCFGLSSYGVIFWLPQIVRQMSGLSNTSIGFVTALPWIAAAVVMVLVGRSSDRLGEHHWHFAASYLVAALGLIGSVMAPDPVVAMLFIALAAIGMWSGLGVFWTIPPQMFSGTAIAGCLALINSIGNLGGFVGPYMIGYTKATTGSFAAGLIGLAVFLVLGAIAAVWLKRATRLSFTAAG